MPAWTDHELRRIGGAEELEIAPVRRDGTRRAPRPIWVVRAGVSTYAPRTARGAAGIASRGQAARLGSRPVAWRRT
jgi:hypothetical protein